MRAFEKRLDVSFFSSFGCEQCELDAALGAVRVHDEIVIEVVDYFQVRVRCFPFPFVQFVERGGDDELAQVARVVLKRSLKRDDDEFDNLRYQSVFANDVFKESAAAPTASLHFDNDLYEKITNEFSTCKINLAVGLGTFKPLSNEAINDSSKLHEENFFISDESAKKINSQLKDKKRIIAIGTTTLRALESSWNNKTNSVSPGKQTTNIFIKEGFKFNVANALLTNFHLPQSSLLMLVCAFAGKELIFSMYEFAIKNNLRFFSYGDAMIIERCPLNY